MVPSRHDYEDKRSRFRYGACRCDVTADPTRLGKTPKAFLSEDRDESAGRFDHRHLAGQSPPSSSGSSRRWLVGFKSTKTRLAPQSVDILVSRSMRETVEPFQSTIRLRKKTFLRGPISSAFAPGLRGGPPFYVLAPAIPQRLFAQRGADRRLSGSKAVFRCARSFRSLAFGSSGMIVKYRHRSLRRCYGRSAKTKGM